MTDNLELCLESLDGAAQPATLFLTPGEQLGPLEVGTSGKWRVNANGVAPLHGMLFYDGSQLYMQSSDANAPIYADGQPLPARWTPIRPPCEIQIGEARVSFDAVGGEIDVPVDPVGIADPDSEEVTEAADATRVVSVNDVMASVARHRATSGMSISGANPAAGPASYPGEPPTSQRTPGTSSPHLERRRAAVSSPHVDQSSGHHARPSNPSGPHLEGGFDPLSSSPGMAAPTPPPAPPAFGSQPGLEGPPSGPTPPTAPTPPLGSRPGDLETGPTPFSWDGPPPSGPTPPSATHGTEGLRPTGTQGPQPTAEAKPSVWKRMSFPQKAIVVLLLPLVASVYIIFTGKPPRQGGKKPAATATATASVTATATTPPPAPEPTEAVEDDGAEEPSGEGGAEAVAQADPQPNDGDPPPPPKIRASKKRTLQRKAVDAVAAARYDDAARLYEELATQYPDNPAYAAAAEITKAKARAARRE